MTIFPQTPRSDWHYLIETTVQGIGRLLSRYFCSMLIDPNSLPKTLITVSTVIN